MRKIDRWYYRIIRDSKCSDIRAKRYTNNVDNITSDHLINLQNLQQNRCYYCQKFMDWIERRSGKNGLTCERLDGREHLIENTVLCCKSCNSKKYTRDIGLLKRYFSIWKRLTFDIPSYDQSKRRCCFV